MIRYHHGLKVNIALLLSMSVLMSACHSSGSVHDNANRLLAGGYTDFRKPTDAERALFVDSWQDQRVLTPRKVSTQVVAGTNYKYLCEDVTGKDIEVVIYKPLPGNGEAVVTRIGDEETHAGPVVRIASGRIQGLVEEGTMAFKGIPYAAVERFMPPKPVVPWNGTRKCTEWGPQAMQGGRNSDNPKSMSEDCCVLNVWTTDLKTPKPVMLWCHGGGFDSGTSAWNPGMCLAKKDVVVVSLNHRLNILGFLDLSATGDPKYRESGNVGMLDVVAALRWIRDNISRFGGDPGNVTVFGESGGGGKVGTLMCMPDAKGLFHKAIIMSGTILNVNTNSMSKQLGLAVLKELGIPVNQVGRINEVPYDRLYQAGQRAMAESVGTRTPGTPMMWGFGPTPDGEVLLQQPFQPAFASISDDIPLVIGTTFNELQRGQYHRQMTLDEAKQAVSATFGDDTDDFADALAEAWPDFVPQDLPSIDPMFRAKTLVTIDTASSSRTAPVYNYMFTWKSPLNGVSAHGAELNFCFNTLHHAGSDLPDPSADDLLLADRMAQAWANFAHTGNPNVEGLPVWHPYTRQNGECFIFDVKPCVRNDFDRRLQDIINRHCFKRLDEFYRQHK
ncbi:MAG: carboxylesterase family protein [Bacteroidaceae bacterium]|nr:carboxylesterase family protein [Bacteroidaceae bacterium]